MAKWKDSWCSWLSTATGGQQNKGNKHDTSLLISEFQQHVMTITKSDSYNLKNTSRFMSQWDVVKRVHVFIFSRLNYCTSVFTGLPKKSIRHLLLESSLRPRKWIILYHSSYQIFPLASCVSNTAAGLQSSKYCMAKIHFWSAAAFWSVQNFEVHLGQVCLMSSKKSH